MAPADVALKLSTLPTELFQRVLCQILEKNQEELRKKDRQIAFTMMMVDEAHAGERKLQKALRAEELDALQHQLTEAGRRQGFLEAELRKAGRQEEELTARITSLESQMLDQAKVVAEHANARFSLSLSEEELRLRDFRFYIWAVARQTDAIKGDPGFLDTILSP